MQDFAPFIPHLLGGLEQPHRPPAVKGTELRQTAAPSASICLLLFNFLLLLQNLLTSPSTLQTCMIIFPFDAESSKNNTFL
jgi:hypothetical protein